MQCEAQAINQTSIESNLRRLCLELFQLAARQLNRAQGLKERTMKTIVAVTSMFLLVGSTTPAPAQPDRDDQHEKHEQQRERKEQRRERQDNRRDERQQNREAERQRQEVDEQRHEVERDRHEIERERFQGDHPGPIYRARVAPPPMRREVRSLAPSPRHVWVDGYWGWQNDRHVWIGGRWELPPAQGQVWVDGSWTNQDGEWVFSPGYWAPGTPAEVYAPPAELTVTMAPPPPRREVMAPQPGPGYFWVAGNWHWDGRQNIWLPGHWEAQRPGWRWEPARWERGPHHWRYRPGHWRR